MQKSKIKISFSCYINFVTMCSCNYTDLIQRVSGFTQVLDEVVVDGLAVVGATHIEHQESILLKGVDLMEGGEGFGVVLH